MAHSAYPELGESAIEKLLDVLADIRSIALPQDARAWPEHPEHRINPWGTGAQCNTGFQASAEIMIRLDRAMPAPVRQLNLSKAVAGRAEIRESHLHSLLYV